MVLNKATEVVKHVARLQWLCGALLFVLVTGCGSNQPSTESALDCGRQFMEAVYQGNFKEAKLLVVNDEANHQLLQTQFVAPFRSMDSFEKERLSQSSLVIGKIESLSPDRSTIQLTNAYTQQPLALVATRQNGTWRVNLQATFTH